VFSSHFVCNLVSICVVLICRDEEWCGVGRYGLLRCAPLLSAEVWSGGINWSLFWSKVLRQPCRGGFVLGARGAEVGSVA